MDVSEIDLVRSSLCQLLATTPASDLVAALAATGWDELLEAEPAVAIGVLAEEQGRTLVAGPALTLALLHGLGLGIDPYAAVVVPPMARTAGAGFAGRVEGVELVVDGMVLGDPATASRLLVPTDEGVHGVEVAAAATFVVSPLAPADPELGLYRVTGRFPRTPVITSPSAWPAAVAFGHRALASELIGLADRMLGDAIAYVLQRQQFGRPIGSFQTVKHRLADVRVAITAAAAGVSTAWADDSALSSMAALCLAARAHQLAATHGHQVHGGIAFTVEHGFHRFIRRGQIVSGLLGRPDDLTRRIGEQLIATGAVPRTPQLA